MKFRITFFFLFVSLLSFSQQQRTETETWALAKSIHQRIVNGNISFVPAATFYSEDPTSKVNGGDLGWVKKGELILDYENLAWSLPIGSVSTPFKTIYGIYILQVIDRNEEAVWTRYILLLLPEEKK